MKSTSVSMTGRADPPQTDSEWAARIRQGEYRAFEHLFRTYYAELIRFAKLMSVKDDTAEDVVQETMASIWEHREKWRPHGSMRAYLYGAVKRQAGQRYRKRSVRNRWFRREGLQGTTPTESDAGPDETMRLRDLRRAVDEAVDELPERRRMIFLLSRNQGLTYAEIGALLNISVKTVDTQIGRSIKFLRRRLAHLLSDVR